MSKEIQEQLLRLVGKAQKLQIARELGLTQSECLDELGVDAAFHGIILKEKEKADAKPKTFEV